VHAEKASWQVQQQSRVQAHMQGMHVCTAAGWPSSGRDYTEICTTVNEGAGMRIEDACMALACVCHPQDTSSFQQF